MLVQENIRAVTMVISSFMESAKHCVHAWYQLILAILCSIFLWGFGQAFKPSERVTEPGLKGSVRFQLLNCRHCSNTVTLQVSLVSLTFPPLQLHPHPGYLHANLWFAWGLKRVIADLLKVSKFTEAMLPQGPSNLIALTTNTWPGSTTLPPLPSPLPQY